MSPMKVAVIGCGQIATTQHLPVYREAAEAGVCSLVGVCDLEPERVAQAEKQFAVAGFQDAEEMLEKTKPDVVSIATLPSSHRNLAVMCLEAGCHVLCEKPVAMDAGEARDMVHAAETNNRLLSICFEYRTWDESRYLRDRIADGVLGRVHAVRTWGGSAYGLPGRAHQSRGANGGGVLAHWTIHNLDLVLWLLGNPEPLTASAFCHQRVVAYPAAAGALRDDIDPASLDPDFEDFGAGFVRLSGNTILTVEADFLQAPSDRREGWALLGDRGAASISPLRIWTDDGRSWREETPAKGTLKPCDYDMRRLINDFLRAVREGEASPVSGPEIIRIQRLMDALYASAASGQEVAVAGA